LVLSPFFILISFLIKITSPGPVFFLQKRMGKGGYTFKLIKFRSMHVNPVEEINEFTPGDDTRITKFGKILRRTKIDELPELINVFSGDMSLVGPRPEVPKYRHVYVRKFEPILSLRPGITDLASIKYRDEERLLAKSPNPDQVYRNEILPDKLQLVLKYMDNISFKTDLKIIFLTLMRLFNAENSITERD